MVNNGNSTDILYLSAFRQMGITIDKLQPVGAPLLGFTRDKLFPLGVIILPVTIGLTSKQITKDVNFLVINCPSAYNTILGWPVLNQMRAITSTYHLMMRFPIDHGVGEVKSDQTVT